MLLSPPARFIYAVCCISAVMSTRWPQSLWFWSEFAVLAFTLAADVKLWWLTGSPRALAQQRAAQAEIQRQYAEHLGRNLYPVGHIWEGFGAEAVERSWSLLCEHLTQEQQQQLIYLGYFSVRGSRGGSYQITKNTTWNVVRMGINGERLCVVPLEPVPIWDHLLAQKLLLEADEKRFRRIANKRPA